MDHYLQTFYHQRWCIYCEVHLPTAPPLLIRAFTTPRVPRSLPLLSNSTAFIITKLGFKKLELLLICVKVLAAFTSAARRQLEIIGITRRFRFLCFSSLLKLLLVLWLPLSLYSDCNVRDVILVAYSNILLMYEK